MPGILWAEASRTRHVRDLRRCLTRRFADTYPALVKTRRGDALDSSLSGRLHTKLLPRLGVRRPRERGDR